VDFFNRTSIALEMLRADRGGPAAGVWEIGRAGGAGVVAGS
jgi:hypothetical protein